MKDKDELMKVEGNEREGSEFYVSNTSYDLWQIVAS